MFARLYNHPEVGQVLFMKAETEEDKPCAVVRFYFNDLNIENSINFADSAEGEAERDEFFNGSSEADVLSLVATMLDHLKNVFNR